MASVFPTTSFDSLSEAFAGRTALIPYITAGYPKPDATVDLMNRLADAGASIIELGVPFSDPVADGPTIQRSSQVALENGITLDWTLETVARFRSGAATPVVVFSYLNPILAYGAERFIEAAVSAGAHGVLLTDLPLDADPELEHTLEASPLALVRLLAPTTPPDRARAIAQHSQGFLYYVSRLGVTGATQNLRDSLLDEVRAVKAFSPVPVAVGFGISTAEQARRVAGVADGVVVGSAIIDALDRGGAAEAAALLKSMRDALDQGS